MNRIATLALALLASGAAPVLAQPAGGWTPLFDGKTLAGWQGFKGKPLGPGWKVVDGAIVLDGKAGDLVSAKEYANFELELEFKIAEGGNSGIMYRVTNEGDAPYYSGPEYQILDNERHPDGKNGPDRFTAANYDLIAPTGAPNEPAGEWNTAKIVVNGNHVEHWLNGTKVVTYEFASPEWNKLVAESKFKAWPIYGKASRGHIVLQDHGNHVEFRNIRIKELK
ncbi:MAG TPA: DUF1080 domain-containing protein [Luteitalea sp.]|nr:DUF1080 domain-containing protein [Luteitalea sp.]